ncbi:hypothetical protein LR48_Vigan07g234800 [Vigna angularis]|uniref:Uncharacterized protein n=3 Tax=Phaseolus angularis TaxID=3914 RepID=A0A0L9V1L6_PHAAN|nr:uncharacterized protein LOC108338446 isoform X1 [Vigna angularis]KOM48644.1 hypothetical protein LR48_Vigan07g234800 [Vigna angularis]BAT82241.1 hypothetical protein VIGAN_03222200 [Vigna angularis var. angularis]
MTRSKANSKKQHGIDFKKIRRKIGRKLPPPKNTTNTEIKSKAIVLPEQSVAAEKAGLAVNKKGLTLKELLQQTSHHNPKVRREALMGIKDLFTRHPAEQKLHRYVTVEKLRERIGDDDKVVRKSLYDLFKIVILPCCKEDNQELVVSLLMPYIFNAMTHFSVDVRMMAFDFLDLILEFYPPSFSPLYAEKIFLNYEDILRRNQYYLQDKGKLKEALSGLVRCLSLLPWNKAQTDLPNKDDTGRRVLFAYDDEMSMNSNGFSNIVKSLKDLVPPLMNIFLEFIPLIHSMESLEGKSFACMISILHSIDLIVRSITHGSDKKSEYPSSQGGPDVADVTISSALLKKLFPRFPLNPTDHLSARDCGRLLDLNMVITKIFFELNEWMCLPPHLLERFLEFFENALLGKFFWTTQSAKAVWEEEHLVLLLPFIPKIVSRGVGDWTSRLLQAFTLTFRECKPGSLLKACVSAIEDVLTYMEGMHSTGTSNPQYIVLQEALRAWTGDLPRLLIQLGDNHPACSQALIRLLHRIGQRAWNPALVCMYNNMQQSLQDFYCTYQEGGPICFGPFLRLPRESQVLALCSIYYFSHLDLPILKSLVYCCLSDDLDSYVLFWIIDVLQLAYERGCIEIADYLSFFITLVARFKVSPEFGSSGFKGDPLCQTLKSMTAKIYSGIQQMGDKAIVLRLIERLIIDQISQKPSLDNRCSLLRMVVSVDSKPTLLSEQSIATLGHHLSEYLIDVVQCVPEDDGQRTPSFPFSFRCYYTVPCFFMLDRCHELMNLVLKKLGSVIYDSSVLLKSDKCSQDVRNCLNKVNAVTSALSLLHGDPQTRRIMSLYKKNIDDVIEQVICLQSTGEISMKIEEHDIMKRALDRLKILRDNLKS